MKKYYFLQIDVYNAEVNDFFYGIRKLDLTKKALPDICKDIVREVFPDTDPDSVMIKLNAFNNVKL